MKRNWNAIRAVSCGVTKVAIATCSDPEILPRLQNAFPECFEEGEETVIGTWSWIRSEWEKYCTRHYGPKERVSLFFTAWGEAVNVPFCLTFGKLGEDSERNEFREDGPIPKEVREQLNEIGDALEHNEWFSEPINIRYLDREWIVSYIETQHSGMWGTPTDEGDGELSMVPKEHIIFDL